MAGASSAGPGPSDCGLAVMRHHTQDRLQVIGRVGTREQPVASGASSPGSATGARPAPQLRGTRRTSASLVAPRARPGNQPLWLHVMHPAPGDRCPRGRQLARQPRGTPTGRCAAAGAATHRSRRPADAPGLDLRHGWADPYRQPPTSGVASRRPAPAEVFSMVRNPLPTS